MSAIVEEDLLARIVAATRFAAAVLEKVDGPGRVADVCVAAALLNSGYMPWLTEREAAQEMQSWVMGSGNERSIVHLSPAVRKRSMLGPSADAWAEDLFTLLRREYQKR